MPSRNTNTRQTLITAAAFILMEVAALVMIYHNAELQRAWFSRGIQSFNATVWGAVEEAGGYFSLRRDNARLAEENLYLTRQVEQLTARLNAQDAPEADGEWTYLPARIVKHQYRGQHNFYLLDKGSGDGVRLGSGVLTARGVVGIIDAVSEHYSYVRSFYNDGMTVSARVDSLGVVAPLVWDGASRGGARLKDIPHHINIPEGSVIRTSSFSGIFPPDVPLGLSGASDKAMDGTQTLSVTLFEEPASLRYVRIVSHRHRDEMEELAHE
ncbi:MAG: rod shape-determining protein MreC [Bacteroidales bacterium]|nr:rod shape-determining protein MreC [Bacteroidales bacterium]